MRYTIHIETRSFQDVTVEAPSREAARFDAQRAIDAGLMPSGEIHGDPASHTRITAISVAPPNAEEGA